MLKFLSGLTVLLFSFSSLYAQSFFNNDFFVDKKEWPKTNFSKKSIDLEEIISGGPPKDGIPAIDQPKFVSVDEASAWIDEYEPVIVVKTASESKAYPLQILMFHEIVNDKLGEQHVAVTFCPLCNASIVFDRKLNSKVLDFGTTGRLRNSDLVMYDRQTESWWQQFEGLAIIGDYTGQQLRELPSQILAFKVFSENYPNGKVLSQDTGFQRPYGKNPYQGYDHINNKPFLLQNKSDPRLPAMERAIGVRHKGVQRLYPFTALKNQAVVNDAIGNLDIVIFQAADMLSALDQQAIKQSKKIASYTVFSPIIAGEKLIFEFNKGKIIDINTSSEWSPLGKAITGKLKGKTLTPITHGVHFAFAWLAFKPDSEIYRR